MPIIRLPSGDLRDEVAHSFYIDKTVDPNWNFEFSYSDIKGMPQASGIFLLPTAVSFRIRSMQILSSFEDGIYRDKELLSRNMVLKIGDRHQGSMPFIMGESPHKKGFYWSYLNLGKNYLDINPLQNFYPILMFDNFERYNTEIIKSENPFYNGNRGIGYNEPQYTTSERKTIKKKMYFSIRFTGLLRRPIQ